MVNPSPIERADVVELDVAVPDDWSSVALSPATVAATQEVAARDDHRAPSAAPRSPSSSTGAAMAGSCSAAELERPDRGRDRPTRPGLSCRADERADPPELDVERLLAEAEAAAMERPDACRRSMSVRLGGDGSSPGSMCRRSVTSGWVRRMPGRDARGGRASGRRETARRLTNGLVEVEVGDDGTRPVRGAAPSSAGWVRIVNSGEAGDSYDLLVEHALEVDVAVETEGPLRGELVVQPHDLRLAPWPDAEQAGAPQRDDGASGCTWS